MDNRTHTILYASTALTTFEEDATRDPYNKDNGAPAPREFRFNSRIYRRLDGTYYAYLYHLLNRAEGATLSGKLPQAAFETLYHRFAAIDEWVRDRIPEQRIQAALADFDVDKYLGPGKTAKRKVHRELRPEKF